MNEPAADDTPTLVDSNVLLDVLTDDPQWFGWSSQALGSAIDGGGVVINPLIYAEVSVRFDSVEQLDESIPTTPFGRVSLPFSAGFVAGKAFARYRRSGGRRLSPLPDFYIGAHALVSGYRLLTRDARRYRTYFPRLELTAPHEVTRAQPPA